MSFIQGDNPLDLSVLFNSDALLKALVNIKYVHIYIHRICVIYARGCGTRYYGFRGLLDWEGGGGGGGELGSERQRGDQGFVGMTSGN